MCREWMSEPKKLDNINFLYLKQLAKYYIHFLKQEYQNIYGIHRKACKINFGNYKGEHILSVIISLSSIVYKIQN